MRVFKKMFWVLVLLLLAGSTSGTITLNAAIANNMVLQRDIGAYVFGQTTCSSGNVTVEAKLGGVTKATGTAPVSGGEFKVEIFHPRETNGMDIVITDCDSNQILTGVMFGEVIHCSGQSNMEYSWGKLASKCASEPCTSIIATLKTKTMFRWLTASRSTSGGGVGGGFTFPVRHGTPWVTTYPDNQYTSTTADNMVPSATCSALALELDNKWGGQMPIGLVVTARGSSNIHPYMSSDAIADASNTCGGNPNVNALGVFSNPTFSASEHWNAWVSPIVKTKFRAMFWLQGERDAQNDSNSVNKYGCCLSSFIKDMRNKGGYELPVYVMELAGFVTSDDTKGIRAIQTKVGRHFTPNGYVVGFDLGERSDIHPEYKSDFGKRAAWNIFRQIGFDVPAHGPEFVNATKETVNGVEKIRIHFRAGTTEAMALTNTKDCNTCCSGSSEFKINNAAVPQSGVTIDGDTVLLDCSAAGVTLASASTVQYAQEDFPQCSLTSTFSCSSLKVPGIPFSENISV